MCNRKLNTTNLAPHLSVCAPKSKVFTEKVSVCQISLGTFSLYNQNILMPTYSICSSNILMKFVAASIILNCYYANWSVLSINSKY